MSAPARIPQAALDWAAGTDTGASSKAIWMQMTGGTAFPGRWPHHPSDPADFGRCERLLRLVPEWRDRLPEMAKHSAEWAALVRRWPALVECMEAECGVDWRKSRAARNTYRMMQTILRAAECSASKHATGAYGDRGTW